MRGDPVRGILFGRDPGQTRLQLAAAAGLFALGLGLHGLVWLLNRYATGWSVDGTLVFWILVAFTIGPAAVAAYRNDGLLVCWVLGAALPVALFLVPTASSSMAPDEPLWWSLSSGLVYGIIAGSFGFAVGILTRRLRRVLRGRPRWSGM